MGKRIEKAFGRDKGQASSASQDHDDDPNRTPEPHICTGHFQNDFTELCRRNQMITIPNVVARPKRPPSPSAVPAPDERPKGGKKDDKKKDQPPPEPEPEPELDENGEPIEPPPKTYVTKDKFAYFKPCVQVEMDNPDKTETVSEVIVRGWRIDEPMMTVFRQCFAKMDRLHTINFWNAGLTDETLDIMATFLPECPNIRTLILDSNPVKGETYYKFLREESHIQHISLRYNQVSDSGAEMIGMALGTPTRANQKLVSLNLNGNKITDKGAAFLVNGLRMNRTLLTLGLANNSIGSEGAKKFAEVISQFKLTHEEIVERRRLKSEKGGSDGSKSPVLGGKRAESRERPASVKSTHTGGAAAANKTGKSAKGKKDGKEKDDKHEKTKGGKKEEKPAKKDLTLRSATVVVAGVVNSHKSGSIPDAGKAPAKKGEKTKGKKGGAAQVEAEDEPARRSSLFQSQSSNLLRTPKSSSRLRAGSVMVEQPESHEMLNPLLDHSDRIGNGEILLIGNRTLISLNLSCNEIGEEGIKALLEGVGKQISLLTLVDNPQNNTGLMRLCVNKNKLKPDHELMQKLQTLMLPKDPFYKPPPTPDHDDGASTTK